MAIEYPYNIDQLLQEMVDQDASDLHLRVGQPAMLRVKGDLIPVHARHVIDADAMKELFRGLLTQTQSSAKIETLRQEKELDLAYALEGQARFRVNVFFERGMLSAVLRKIPEVIPLPEEIGLPEVMNRMAELQRGLVLVTGPTGSGKSTSLAAVIRRINETRPVSILTLEDPVEFIHQPAKAVIRQREVGKDMHSFARGLRAALRQDPDVILVGEMRDLETIEIAITAAETGHLVFGTLHTRSAEATIDRVIDVFPSAQQDQIRTQLSNSLAAIMCQALLPTADMRGRCAAHEVLVMTPAVRHLIRGHKPSQIRSTMQTQAGIGMQTMDKSLADLVISGRADEQVARERAQDPAEFDKLIASANQTAAPAPAQKRSRRGRGGDDSPEVGAGVSMGGS
ncbi:type IV pilus twitching motility protein PilT [Miltoncostaea oceani]|uniref:type IV pilus twitching motility protein PilT n=1 Tax=Miltoncostaea oceani TaxID=2843216 RepID=UPI001C3C7675|nr:type IV pilus twitching motility protein PilT [Miltoncostaea oceani]